MATDAVRKVILISLHHPFGFFRAGFLSPAFARIIAGRGMAGHPPELRMVSLAKLARRPCGGLSAPHQVRRFLTIAISLPGRL